MRERRLNQILSHLKFLNFSLTLMGNYPSILCGRAPEHYIILAEKPALGGFSAPAPDDSVFNNGESNTGKSLNRVCSFPLHTIMLR